MSSIPSNISRSPSLLIQQIQLANITRTNLSLFDAQAQLSTGRSLLRPSDNPVAAVTVSALDDSIERSSQRLRNIDQADTNLALIETSLSEANDLLLSAKSIASEQVNLGSTSTERTNQAAVVDSLLAGLLEQMNRQSVDNYLFGGSRISRQPFEEFGTGILYTGESDGLTTDLGLGTSLPVTLSGIDTVGEPGRVNGTVNLDPQLTDETRLSDLNGGRGLGVSTGPVQLLISGAAEPIQLDLTNADTIEDVVARIESAIQSYETTNAVTVLGPGGVGFAGERFTIDVAAGASVSFAEVGTGSTTRDLGLTTDAGFTFDATNADGIDLDPKLTLRSSVASLAGLAGPLDEIQIRNAGRLSRVDLTGAATIEDIKNRIETAGTGVRVDINANRTGIDIVNLVSAEPDQSLSISEVTGGEETANLLGIRTFSETTRIDRLNDGRGVRVLSGRTDPETGLAAPELDIDFEIGLGDGSAVTVNLRPEDLTNAGTLVARINAEAASQGVAPGDFQAQLGNGDRGLILTQNPAFAGDLTVSQRNNSQAAFDLGLLNGEYDAVSATFAGEDRAQVVTDTVFTRLLQQVAVLFPSPGVVEPL
ncbi:MAG: hypothetical protein AAFN41_06950, partial [Planctomycetota bacterium]